MSEADLPRTPRRPGAEIDILLIDIGAGISDTVVYFNLAAQEKIILVTLNQPPTDAYALIKILYTRHNERHFKILTNAVKDDASARQSSQNMRRYRSFPGRPVLDYLGAVPHDPACPKRSFSSASSSFTLRLPRPSPIWPANQRRLLLT